MLSEDNRLTLSGQLERLLAAQLLAPSVQRAGTHLHRRLRSDIRIILAGPQEAGKLAVLQSLNKRALPHTVVRTIPWGEEVARDCADVCIWLTQDFAADEYELWDRMPNRLKDHSFLAPVVQSTNANSAPDPALMEAMDAIAVEEFNGLCVIFLPPSKGGSQPDGIDSLVGQIASTIENGLAADTDNVQMFLAQYAEARSDLQSDAPQVTKSDLQTQAGLGSDRTAKEPRVAPEIRQVLEPVDPPLLETDLDLELFRAAHDGLCAQITALEPLTHARTDAEFAQVLSTCRETIEAAAIILANCRAPGWDDVQNAADEVLLMSMEGGVGPAITAVTTLLQIKRQLEVEVWKNDTIFT